MPSKIETVIAFDYGERRIGVAVGQTLSGTAQPLVVLKQIGGKIDWQGIQTLFNEWRPEMVLVGFPETADGKTIPLHDAIKRFSAELITRFGLPLEYCDEHLSSHAAKQKLELDDGAQKRRGKNGKKSAAKSARKPGQNPGLDAVAAQVILETWLSDARLAKN